MNEKFQGGNNNTEEKTENLEKIYNQDEAEKIRQEKMDLIKNLNSRFKECNLFAELYGVVPDIDKMFFSNLPDKENETHHIFHHVLAGSNIGIDADYYYDEKDKEAEEFVLELLAIEDKNEFVERCRKIITETEEQRIKDRNKKLAD